MATVEEGKNDISLPVQPRLRRFILALTITLVTTGLILWLLPYAIEKVAVSWLQQHGVEDARIDNIDLNLFSGEMVLEGLKSGDGLNINHLSIDFDWLPLWHHIVHIRTLTLNASSLHLLERKGIWQVAGIKADVGKTAVSPTADDGQPWVVVVDDLVLDSVTVKVKTDLFALSLPLKSLHLSLSGIQKQQQKVVNSIAFGDTIFSGFGYTIELAAAKVAGEVAFSILSKDIVASLKSNKLSLALQGLEIRSKHDKRQISVAALTFDGIALGGKDRIHIASTAVNKLRIRHALNGQGQVNLAGVKISAMDVGLNGDVAVARLGLKKLSTEGFDKLQQSLSIEHATLVGISMSPPVKKAVQHVHIKALDVKNIALKHAADDGSITLKQLNLAALNVGLDGSVALAKLGIQQMKAEAWTPAKRTLRLDSAKLVGLAISSEKTIALQTLSLHKGDLFGPDQSGLTRKYLLGAFENASLEQFSMTGPDVGSFKLIKLEGVQLPSAGTMSLGSVGLIQASHAVLEKGGMYRVKQLKIDQLQAHLVKQKDGWLLPAGMGGTKPKHSAQDNHKAQTSVNKADSDTTKAQLTIDTVLIGAGSQIELHDESVTPALATTMRIETLRFSPLDSSGKQRGKLDVKMKLGKSGALSLEGTTNVAAGKQLDADIHLVLENFDLPRLSGYVEADLGRSIKTGQLNLDSDISIKNNSIHLKNKVLIRKLALEDSQHAHGSGPKISLAGGMSVDMALGMLQDDRGDVKLNVPVSGPLDNPDIKLNHIINKALLASLKTGALTYAALALQPYGSIILAANVARGIIKEAAKPKLTPVDFAERQTILTARMNDYISKIARLMKKKDFRLQVCGIATRIEGEKVIQPGTRPNAEPGPETLPAQTESFAYMIQAALNDEQLLKLAQQRSDLVMAALHQLDIADKQVFNCHPRIDEANKQAQPRVELLLDY